MAPRSNAPTRSAIRSELPYCGTAFLAACCLRIAACLAFPDFLPVSDGVDYVVEANAFIERFPGTLPYFWPPGNPLFIAGLKIVLGVPDIHLKYAYAFLGGISCALVYMIGRASSLSSPQSLFAGLIYAVYPASLLMSLQPLTQEPVTVALLSFCLFTTLSWRFSSKLAAIGAGASLAAAILIRPGSLSVLPVFLWTCFRTEDRDARTVASPTFRESLLRASVFVLVICMITLPAVLLNAAVGGGFVVSTNNERNFFLGNNKYTPLEKPSQFGQRRTYELEPDAARYLQSFGDHDHPRTHTLEDRQRMISAALTFIVEHPARFGLLSLSRIKTLFGFDYFMARVTAEYYGFPRLSMILLLGFEAGGFLIVASLIAIGMVTGFSALPTRWIVLATGMLYLGPHVVAFSSPMYHIPVVALFSVFAGQGFSRAGLGRLRQERRMAALLLGVLAALILVQFDQIRVLTEYYNPRPQPPSGANSSLQ